MSIMFAMSIMFVVLSAADESRDLEAASNRSSGESNITIPAELGQHSLIRRIVQALITSGVHCLEYDVSKIGL